MEIYNKNEETRISVADYINNKSLLEIKYVTFDTKLEIVSQVINSVINAVGGLNSSLLRRVSTEIFISSITNIDMNIKDENDLDGLDQLYYHREFNELIANLGEEYKELQMLLNERVADYIRIETNPSVTINKIYEQIVTYFNTLLDSISDYIQNVDVEELSEKVIPMLKDVINNNES